MGESTIEPVVGKSLGVYAASERELFEAANRASGNPIVIKNSDVEAKDPSDEERVPMIELHQSPQATQPQVETFWDNFTKLNAKNQ
jgi:hypothetical protein